MTRARATETLAEIARGYLRIGTSQPNSTFGYRGYGEMRQALDAAYDAGYRDALEAAQAADGVHAASDVEKPSTGRKNRNGRILT